MSRKNEADRNSLLPPRKMRRRGVLFAVAIGVLFCLLVARLGFLQIVQGEFWSNKAVSQQLNDSLVAAHRGTIYDCNGKVLAESMEVWTVIMTPANIAQLDDAEAVRVKIADEVSKILDVDRDTLYKKTTRTDSQYEKIASQVEYPVVEELIAWAEKNKLSNSGIFRVVTDYKRTYPYGSLASCVIGFTGTDYYGLYGLEAEYNDVLAGVAGRVVTAQNGVGGDMPVSLTYEKTVDAQDGHSLVLTIDQTIQHYAEKYLEQSITENAVLSPKRFGSVKSLTVTFTGTVANAAPSRSTRTSPAYVPGSASASARTVSQSAWVAPFGTRNGAAGRSGSGIHLQIGAGNSGCASNGGSIGT